MKKLVYRDSAGAVINIGPWDLCVQQDREPVYSPIELVEVDGVMRRSPKPREIINWIVVGERITNPIPDGVTFQEEEIVERDDGGFAAASDHASLRRVAYPSIADQLDALWKGGYQLEAMRTRVMGVKARFPKAEK